MSRLYDVVGIGIGPYNLGLAALMEKTELEGIFLDRTPEFRWHPGMMIEKMDLQVPFLADVVTFADPTSPYSYLNYLHKQNRMFKFFFYSEFKVPRPEYNAYLSWVANQLENLRFGKTVVDVIDHKDDETPHYEVVVKEEDGQTESYFGKHVVMGTGSEPLILDSMSGFPVEDVLHTSSYLYEKENLLHSKHVTVVGSGQSAAEVFLDLLQEQMNRDMHLTLLTRSGGLFQLDSSKLGQEFFSPDYVDYFHSLSYDQRMKALDTLGNLRKGIDPDTLIQLYETLYHRTVDGKKANVTIQPLTEVQEINAGEGHYTLKCKQWQKEETFDYHSEKVVLATGYKPHIPKWFQERFADEIEWEDDKRYKVTRDFRLEFKDTHTNHFFTLTNLEHSHGAGATNLGLAVQRNIEIINLLAGKEIYQNQRDTIFQQFTMDEDKKK
ncbi:lysine N(6)-hydroxylase/L-ornithine N(5)-oxygenase family protein [Thalassobacillus hwangdonensis]|uniref:L-lysine N6-monooxygenase MbtG n=1 Tax=Thalassobacillus hwangdonensis TaxID=546108 RepID=A0ABW3L0N9_9BACI